MLRTLWPATPRATRFGLALAAVGLVLDLIHHTLADLDIAVIGHVLTLAGMVLAMTGVIHAAAASRHRRQKGERNAARSSSAGAR